MRNTMHMWYMNIPLCDGYKFRTWLALYIISLSTKAILYCCYDVGMAEFACIAMQGLFFAVI